MATITWRFTENQFANATRGSFKKMLTFCADHDAKLFGRQGEADILPLYTRFHPQYLAYSSAYAVWQASRGSYAGGTDAMQQKLEELESVKARQWDVKVQTVFDKGTPQYTAIFPNGRAPFQSGTMDQQISAVETLHEQMVVAGAALPAALVTEVGDYHTTLVTLRTAQQAKEGAADDGSTFLETTRVATAALLYGNLGLLMDIYRETPDRITDFYELSIIRRKADEDEEEDPVPPPVV